MQLLVHLFHEVSQFDLIFVAFIDEELFVAGDLCLALVAQVLILLNQLIYLLLRLTVHFRQLDILVEAMGGVFNNGVCAERLRTRLAVEKEF